MNRFTVEGFDSTQADKFAGLAKILSDLGIQYHLSSEDGLDTISNNINKVTEQVLTEKNKNIRVVSDDITQADTNVVTTAYYLSRSKDLVNLAKDVENISSGQVNTVATNKKLTERQNEINEWSNYSKLEILYFMQVLFISLSLFSLLAYLLSISYISSSLFWTIVSAVSLINLLIILFKLRFTAMNRDGRYWHKMRFANEPYTKSS